MEVVNYFGPPLVKINVNQSIVDDLLHYSDHIMKQEVIPSSINANNKLYSAVNREFEVKRGILDDVDSFLLQCGNEYQRRFGKDDIDKLGTLFIEEMWIVSQKESEWNYLHSHSGLISGVMYLKVPADPGHGLDPRDKRSILPGGISFTDGSAGPFHKRIVSYKPVVGEFYIFPSTMLHTVYPFFGTEERRSFSFNLTLVNNPK